MARDPYSPYWETMKFMVFDLPEEKPPVEQRFAMLKQMISPNHPFISIITMVQCTSSEHFNQFTEETFGKGAEGVMMRQKESYYQIGKSQSLRKIEVFTKHLFSKSNSEGEI